MAVRRAGIMRRTLGEKVIPRNRNAPELYNLKVLRLQIFPHQPVEVPGMSTSSWGGKGDCE